MNRLYSLQRDLLSSGAFLSIIGLTMGAMQLIEKVLA